LFCKDFLIDPDYPNDIYSSIINVSEWYRIVPNDLIHRLFRVINVYVKQNKRR
jgi:hypothetical protein